MMVEELVIKDIDKKTDSTERIKKAVRIWLLIGVVMVFFQIVIGGVTRLTDSGLSITEWDIIQGTIPPMNEVEWEMAFEQYQQMARKQYESLHADMSMSEFKVIFFWEYFHRLWARMMGLVFAIPFVFFAVKKWIPKWLMRRLGVVILLAATAATFGWIMVKSGLNDDTRTWVSAYKLSTHLLIATSLFGYLFWTYLKAAQPTVSDAHLGKWSVRSRWLLGLLVLQIVFGGLMAGMRAGLIHPYFPAFVEGDRLVAALNSSTNGLETFVDYEGSTYVKAIVQIVHRATAYLLFAAVIWFGLGILKSRSSVRLKRGASVLMLIIGAQFLLGVLTVVNSIGKIPILYGVMHQGVAFLLLISLLFVSYQMKSVNKQI